MGVSSHAGSATVAGMGLFSFLRMPGQDALDAMCRTYERALDASGGDSRVAFEALSVEALAQLRARDKTWFSDVEATWVAVGFSPDALHGQHERDRARIERYLFLMTRYAADEHFMSMDLRKEDRLRDAISRRLR
jgi:hypothetical protein